LQIPGLGGRAARDSAGKWVVAQSVPKADLTDRSIRIRKLTEDGFDITIGGSGNDDLPALLIMPDGDILPLGTTDSKDFPVSPSALWDGAAAPKNPSSFLVRFDSAGKVRTSTYLAASGLSIPACAFAVAPDGSLIIGAATKAPPRPSG